MKFDPLAYLQLKQRDYVYVQSYKHDGNLHRTWTMGMVIESSPKHLTVVTNKSWVLESDGRTWLTREPAIWFFYPDYWFNICAMIRRNGIYYYCNLASPIIYDNEAIKYIDYDLDYKLLPDGRYMLLDENEFNYHQEKMNYGNELVTIIQQQKNLLKQWIENYHFPFDDDYILNQYDLYLKLKQDN